MAASGTTVIIPFRDRIGLALLTFLKETEGTPVAAAAADLKAKFEALEKVASSRAPVDKQREAADKIRADTIALQGLQGEATPDQQKVDELSNTLLWETRIFEDRRRVVKFVCEVPTAIDQRLFALGRVIQQEIE